MTKTHPRQWHFAMGHEPEDFWIHGSVRARTADKAFKKARRIQLKTGWKFMAMGDLFMREPIWRRNTL